MRLRPWVRTARVMRFQHSPLIGPCEVNADDESRAVHSSVLQLTHQLVQAVAFRFCLRMKAIGYG